MARGASRKLYESLYKNVIKQRKTETNMMASVASQKNQKIGIMSPSLQKTIKER